MKNFEIKSLFDFMDIDKDGIINDSEWMNFYEFFLDDF